ncbi:hypothetical protein DFR59_101405 [Falsibacillus pallidus]|uniref:Uncharacterized protein n=1 Tax=Falsibacillus pallidus TaxID=493781 RepID=A0A370GVQ2_9BACI|nr:hypothetical protein DFR59_101405 [Falsibacillus pallidus]
MQKKTKVYGTSVKPVQAVQPKKKGCGCGKKK